MYKAFSGVLKLPWPVGESFVREKPEFTISKLEPWKALLTDGLYKTVIANSP